MGPPTAAAAFVAPAGSLATCGATRRVAVWRQAGASTAGRPGRHPLCPPSRLPGAAGWGAAGARLPTPPSPSVVMAASKKGEGARGGSSRKKKRPAAAAAAAAPDTGAGATARPDRTTVADSNPGVPRTADDIKAAYDKKMAEKPKDTKSWLEKIYIISPFASQTGERPPWYLNPNITFVIVFVVVGIAFYAVVASGGVHQGYVNGAPPDVNPFTK